MAFEGASPRKLTNIAFLELSRHMTSHERRLADTTITNKNQLELGSLLRHLPDHLFKITSSRWLPQIDASYARLIVCGGAYFSMSVTKKPY
tara:strand:- start:135 stop:407 length:273 start_codon:yes stop_codon:yes gene_type:complete